jgi:nucleolar protein 12
VTSTFNLDGQPLSKQLQRHILTFVPTAKIESVRFRSIPFQTPTSKLPTSDDEGDDTKTKHKPQTPRKEARPHDRERASVWRSKTIDKDEAVVKQDEKKYITPNQKKKIAFINQEFHSTADTVNAYIVFAHPVNTEHRPSNLPPISPSLDPYEAAQLVAERCDGTLFMERIIRVDLVGKNNDAGFDTDPKLSVFVGNLDFASKEEDLRVFFEGLMASEKGLPPSNDDDDMDEGDQRKPSTWVTRVRIVRDKDTQLGKGFAYVQFTVSLTIIHPSSSLILIIICLGQGMRRRTLGARGD